MRIYELAKELGATSKELLLRLQADGLDIKNAANAIDDVTADKLRAAFKPATPGKAKSKVATPPADAKPIPKTVDKQPAEKVAPKPMDRQPTGKPAQKAAVPKKTVDRPAAPTPPITVAPPSAKPKVIVLRGAIVVRELAEQLGLKPNMLITELMGMNVLASINERLDLKIAQKIAEKHGVAIELEKKSSEQKAPLKKEESEEIDPIRPEELETRPPVVTFLGHIDHGKTSLLDRIRNAGVAKQEAGGITQHIGAYTIEHLDKKITFLDTPGHAAFTAMRARGANLTDIAVIVVAADDGIMPQTEEAIQHARAAEAAIIVAINKMDLPTANPDRVKQQLQTIGLTPEDWGGTTICCPVSALTGAGMNNLLEMILLQAEMLELKSTAKGRAAGFVVEARMEPGQGPAAHLLVTRGTLRIGDMLVCGAYCGRVKALINEYGIRLRSAPPATPVKCIGLSGVPLAGEQFVVFTNDRDARELTKKRAEALREQQRAAPVKVSLENLFSHMAQSQRLELRIILKCDTRGSLEAIQKALEELQSEKVAIALTLCGVGNVNENDILLAKASAAIIIGFNVSKEEGVANLAKREGIEIRLYNIIYDIVDQLREALTGMLAPEIREKFVAKAEVRQIFPMSKRSQVAGCLLLSGRVNMRCFGRVVRNGEMIFQGKLASLRRFQDDVSEVREGQECGICLDNFAAFETGDTIDFFETEKIPQKL